MSQTVEGAKLASRSRNAIVACWLVIAILVVLVVTYLVAGVGLIELQTFITFAPLLAAAHMIVFIVSAVLVAMWIHRAHANLSALGVYKEFTPWWAIGWFFVPFMNLIKPFQAMRELWTSTMGEHDSFAAEAPGEVKAWWAAWIVGNILTNVSLRLSMAASESNLGVVLLLDAVSSACFIASAWLLIKLIREITKVQTQGWTVAQVFD